MSTDGITIEISPGELIDRISILQIKAERMRDERKLARVRQQLETLLAVREASLPQKIDLTQETLELRAVNTTLWDVEDELRLCEREARFDRRFIELARQVYQTNDRRAALKRSIDQRVGSPLIEEKEYVDYRSPKTAPEQAKQEPPPAEFQSEMQAGNDCYNRGELTTAGEHYRRAIEIEPRSVEANYNLGVVLADSEQWDEATQQFRQTLELNRQTARAWNYLGIIDASQGRYEAAENNYRRAIELRHQFPDAHFNLGQLLLRCGRLQEGFQESEWRWQTSQFTPMHCPHPRWDGRRLDGTLLIHTEQGAGDAMQFIRYVPLAAQRCTGVMLVCTDNLAPLFQSVPGISQIRGPGNIPLSEFQRWLPLMSLPHVFETTIETIPCETPYLHPPADRAAIDLGPPHVPNARLRVGLSWAGSPTHRNDRHRSCRLADFAPLLELPDIAFYSLQVGPKATELGEFPDAAGKIKDLADWQQDFSDAALIMQQLDLVVSVDTAVLHLAGALARPAWGLLSELCDWRWLVERDDSPWYPSLRLFRQRNLDDWSELMQRVAAALRSY